MSAQPRHIDMLSIDKNTRLETEGRGFYFNFSLTFYVISVISAWIGSIKNDNSKPGTFVLKEQFYNVLTCDNLILYPFTCRNQIQGHFKLVSYMNYMSNALVKRDLSLKWGKNL